MTKLRSFFKPAFYGFMLFLFTNFFMPEMVLAQEFDANQVGPFAAFLNKAATLFFQTRNALFILAIFAFLAYAYQAITDGKVDHVKIFYLIIGLTILGVAGFVVNYMAGNKIDVQQNSNLSNVEWQSK